MQLESDLNQWVMGKIYEGTFSEMIRHIADRGGYPLWPGLIAILIGIAILYYQKRRRLDATPRKT